MIVERNDLFTLRLLGALEATPEILAQMLKGLTDKEADRRPDSERFSIREVIAHLADWEGIWEERLRRTRDEAEPALPNIDEEQLAIDHDYAHSDMAEQMRLFTSRRANTISLLHALEPAQWQRTAIRGQMGRMSLQAQALFIPLHDMYHLRQVSAWQNT